jgi:hypothetical protein
MKLTPGILHASVTPVRLPLLLLAAVAAAPGAATAQPQSDPESGPWRLGEQLGLPEWIEVSGEQQVRFESLDEEFRANAGGSNQALVVRHLLALTLRGGGWRGVGELIDARAFGEPEDGFISSGIVDPIDLLQAYVGLELEGALAVGDRLDLRLGRQTLDFGGRRLVARNRFRQSVNAFTGLAADWRGGDGTQLHAFAVSPVERLPADADALHDDEAEADEELWKTLFWGAHAEVGLIDSATKGELYLYLLDEEDEAGVATRDRRIATLGARLSRKPGAAEWGYDCESVFQFGKSRASTASATDLDHEAYMLHLAADYRFRGQAAHRLGLMLDVASGGVDGENNNRFDNLFGARVPDFGPMSLFGPLGPANLISPGVRYSATPLGGASLQVTHRAVWVAEEDDALAFTKVTADPGDGSFGGQQTDLRLRWDVAPKSLRLELGFARLWSGDIIDVDTNYAYIQTNFSF